MTAGVSSVTGRPAWKALEAHHRQVRDLHLRQLFADDPGRGERMSAEAVGIYLDYSKNRVTGETLGLLLQLAQEANLRGRIDAMFRARRSMSPKAAPFCTSHCARPGPPRSWSMA
jgi:glucose-6-phosphate isomerase